MAFCAIIPTIAQAVLSATLVTDMRNGKILYEDNADTRLHPASLTKMITLYICFTEIRKGALTLDTPIRISDNAANQPPSRLGLRAGQTIALRYLIRAAAVKSANDAAAAIGDAIGGDEANFARLMTETAHALGMKNSTFKNANGLTRPGHLSTAHDMAIIARHLYFDFPEYYNIFSRRSTNAGLATVYSTNRKFLDAYPGADGIKTGFTWASGFNLVASAKHGDKRLVGVIFGETSTNARNIKMEHLFDKYFPRVPDHVTVKPPPLPNMSFLNPQLIASADHKSQLLLTDRAKNTAVASSARPQPRPMPGVLDNSQVASADVETPTPGLAAAVAANLQDQDEGEGIDMTQQNAPRDDATVEPADNGSAMAPVKLAVTPAPRPAAFDASNAAPMAVASAAAPTDTAVPIAGEEILRPERQVKAAEAKADTPPSTVVVAAAPAPAAKLDAVDNIEPTSAAATVSAPLPKPRPGILFASIKPEATGDKSAPQVISRMSTSGGHDWAITLGRYPSQIKAEEILVKTALEESATLGTTLRKVVRHPNGFEANFVGMTQDKADLACRQLQARSIQCFALAP